MWFSFPFLIYFVRFKAPKVKQIGIIFDNLFMSDIWDSKLKLMLSA